jgi:hypothetical protein
MVPIAKLEAFVSKINGLEGSTWIKSEVVMKKTFKDWKLLLASTPYQKGWHFRIRQIIRAIIVK